MLPRQYRLTKVKDWQQLRRRGRGLAATKLALRWYRTGAPVTRFGFTTATTVSKRANQRNLLKRQLRAIVRQYLPTIQPGFDVAVAVRPGAVGTPYAALDAELTQLLRRSHLL
ncbi:MAG: ribonuclease P protein component [Patescibacteria group bacterium]